MDILVYVSWPLCEVCESGIALLKDINIFNFVTDFSPVLWQFVYMPTKYSIWFFFFFLQIYTFIYFPICLNPWGVQHYTDSVSIGLRLKSASDLAQTTPLFSMSMNYLSPDYSGFVPFATRSQCIILDLLHISTSLAQNRIQFHLQHKCLCSPWFQQKWPGTTAFQTYPSF